MNRYVNILTIKVFDIKFEINIGNPMYYFQEFKELKKGKK